MTRLFGRRRPEPEPPNPVDLWAQADGDPHLYALLYAETRVPPRRTFRQAIRDYMTRDPRRPQ